MHTLVMRDSGGCVLMNFLMSLRQHGQVTRLGGMFPTACSCSPCIWLLYRHGHCWHATAASRWLAVDDLKALFQCLLQAHATVHGLCMSMR